MTGFVVLDAAGRVLARVDDILIALPLQRRIDAAEDVRRVADGVTMATKGRFLGESFYSLLWGALLVAWTAVERWTGWRR